MVLKYYKSLNIKMYIVIFKRISKENHRKILICLCLIFCLILMFYSTPRSSFYSSKIYVPNVDIYNSHLLSDKEVEGIESTYTNIPLKYWIHVKKQSTPYRMNSSCAPFPNLFELDFTQTVWQSVRLSNATIQMFNAYYDPRPVTTGTNVRIPCMIDRTEVYFTIYCQMWFEGDTKPIIVKVEKIHYMWLKAWGTQKDKQYGPYLIECKIPESHKSLAPKVLSIVENPCDTAKNLMRVQNIQTPEEGKKNFTVCVKGLDFLNVDLSARLVEWLEFLFIMGVDKVYMYNLQSHPNIEKVTDYYSKLGKVDIRPITLPEGQVNFPVLQHMFIKKHLSAQCLDELIPYNDCFYRTFNLYKYVALLDIDEIIVPQNDYDWNGLMERILNQSEYRDYASYNVRNTFFLDDMTPEGIIPDIPPYMHMLQHPYRSYNFTPVGWYVKSFFNTDFVIACHNHFPRIHTPAARHSYGIQPNDAHMQHYRSTCPSDIDCKPYKTHIIKDTGIWRYKDILIKNTNRVLEAIGLLE